MSIPTPFAIYSRCVSRSERSPESDVSRNCNKALVAENDIDSFQFQVDASNRHVVSPSPSISAAANNACFIESGWVSRKEGETLNFSHPGSALSASIDQVHSFSASTAYESLNRTQEPGTVPYARHRLQSIHNLPHPSELRRKSARKRQQTEIECPVYKHVHQLLKKKALYYDLSGPSVTEEVQPPLKIEDSTKDKISTDQDHLPCLHLKERTVDSFVAQVPITYVPIDEETNLSPLTKPDSREREDDDEDTWLRQHWQSRPTSQNPVSALGAIDQYTSTISGPVSAPRPIDYTSTISGSVSVLLTEDHTFVSLSKNHMSSQKDDNYKFKPHEE